MATCCVSLATIPKFCGGVNAPGLDRKLAIACGDDVATIPAAVDHVISTAITMRAADSAASPPTTAGVFFGWNFAKEDQEFTSEKDDNGLWKTVVKIFVPKLAAMTSNILNNVNGDDKISIVKDRNGAQRLIGSLTEGCSVKVKEQTNPKNGYVVEILWESSHSPYFYTSTIAY